jgi:hypothetical protein
MGHGLDVLHFATLNSDFAWKAIQSPVSGFGAEIDGQYRPCSGITRLWNRKGKQSHIGAGLAS